VVATGCRGYILCVVAGFLGEPSLRPKKMSMNPLAYLDAYGSLCCLFYGFGWPLKFSYDHRNFKNPRLDEFILWGSGSLCNLFIGILAAALMPLLPVYFSEPLLIMALMNFITGIFSLVPLYPLSGYRILEGFLSFRQRFFMEKYYSVMMLICILWLFVFGASFMTQVGALLVSMVLSQPSYPVFGLVFLLSVLLFGGLKLYAADSSGRG
jgi:Zn-dependent protease